MAREERGGRREEQRKSGKETSDQAGTSFKTVQDCGKYVKEEKGEFTQNIT